MNCSLWTTVVNPIFPLASPPPGTRNPATAAYPCIAYMYGVGCHRIFKGITAEGIVKMKKCYVFLWILGLMLVASSAFAWGNDVSVRGYTRNDGTYVQPSHRTAPDNTMSNNYSTYGNTNPYTGEQGTVRDSGSFGGSHNSNSFGSTKNGWNN